MKFDAMAKYSDDEYLSFTRWLKAETATELMRAKGNEFVIRTAIRHYLEIGYQAHLTSGQMVDYFCVSTPSILDMADYTESEAEAAVKLYDEINPELFAKYYPENP